VGVVLNSRASTASLNGALGYLQADDLVFTLELISFKKGVFI
jgi:hypothetical protein